MKNTINITQKDSMDLLNRELITARTFNAPIELVWEAWTNPKNLTNWWGPKGFTNTFHTFDLKPEGDWKFTMRSPDGSEFLNHSIFEEIAKPEKLTFRHISGHIFKVVVTFDDSNGQTKLTFKMIFETKEECDETKVYAVDANEQNFDRLEEELARMKN
jgi:uncharacterized protein YndB with AHSA1/START domain